MLVSSLFSGSSQQSQPKAAETQKDTSETNEAETQSNKEAAQETQPSAEAAPAQSSQAAAPAQNAQTTEAPASAIATPDAKDTGMSEAQARAAAEARIEAAQARSLIDQIAPVSSSPQQANKSYLSALLKSNAPTEAASAKSIAEPVADKAVKPLKAAA